VEDRAALGKVPGRLRRRVNLELLRKGGGEARVFCKKTTRADEQLGVPHYDLEHVGGECKRKGGKRGPQRGFDLS